MVSASWSGRVKGMQTSEKVCPEFDQLHARMLTCSISHKLQRATTGIR
jgi:hypothetical protein